MEVLCEKMMFWKKPKMLEEGKDFAFVDFKNTDITGIQMIAGNYEGVVYHYHQAKVVEEGEMARLKFGFTIIHPGKHDIDLLKDDEDFVTIMGDILTQVITNKAKADEQIRTDDSQEFNL